MALKADGSVLAVGAPAAGGEAPVYTNAVGPLSETVDGWNGGDPALDWAVRFKVVVSSTGDWTALEFKDADYSNNYLLFSTSANTFNANILQWRTHTPQGVATNYAGGHGRIKIIVDMSAYTEVEVLLSYNSQGYTHDGTEVSPTSRPRPTDTV